MGLLIQDHASTTGTNFYDINNTVPEQLPVKELDSVLPNTIVKVD